MATAPFRMAEMTKLQEAEKVVSALTRAEKAELLKRLVQDIDDAFPGIERTEGVCGGAARIVCTRLPVWTLEQARRLGTTEADLLRSYPALRAEDLANAWAYVHSHLEEIERNIRENEEA